MQLTHELFQMLFRQHYTALVQFAFGFVRSETVAEDLVQQVFVRVWEQRKVLQVNVTWKGYLYTAVRNQALNELRQTSKTASLDGVTEQVQSGTPLSAVEHSELSESLHVAMEELPPKCQEIFRLKRQEGLSYRKIAEQLGVSEKTVENQLGIALKKLRKHLMLVWNEHNS